jgi:chromatin assembly factor 1 subunit A
METPTIAPQAVTPVQQLTPSSKKRNHEGDLVAQPNSSTPSIVFNTTIDSRHSRAISLLSDASTSLTELSSTPVHSPDKNDMNTSEVKKRKLTFAEREVERVVKRREKEEKEQAKAAAMAKKDEEKRLRDEEKQRRDEEKEAARKLKEFQKAEKLRAKQEKEAEKEAERQRKEAEALKKQRVMMLLLASPLALLTYDSHKCDSVHSLGDLLQPQHLQQLLTMRLWELRAVDLPSFLSTWSHRFW